MLLGEELTARTARELGVIHEVVAGDAIGGAAALVARHSGDAASAYAYTKRTLQADAVARMRTAMTTIDRTELPGLLGAPATRRLLAERYRRIKGVAPSWAPAD
jgi:enoyl-CoA hydratase/carnithine racemase